MEDNIDNDETLSDIEVDMDLDVEIDIDIEAKTDSDSDKVNNHKVPGKHKLK
jgi:hypothetical protein